MPAYSFDALSVLVAEDNPHMQRLLVSIFRALGIRKVLTAVEGGDALRVLDGIPVDIVFADYLMEPMDGLEMTRRIRSSPDSPNPYVPIVMVTAHATPGTVRAAREAGVTELLVKPVSVRAVAARLVEVIERPRPFVRQPGYFGPDRRRRVASFEIERRGAGGGAHDAPGVGLD